MWADDSRNWPADWSSRANSGRTESARLDRSRLTATTTWIDPGRRSVRLGMAGADAGKLVMKQGERIRITMNNTSTMWHPMHTHGHTFAVPDYGGLRRDTVNVLPGT